MVNFVRGGTRIYDTSERTKTGLEAGPQAGQAEQFNGPGDNYLSALLKLVPAEVISIYMAIRDSAVQHDAQTSWFILCLITCVVLRAFSNLPRKPGSGFKDVQWRSVVVSAVAFFLWAFAIGSEKPPIPTLHLEQWLASALAALFGILAPLLVPGDTGEAPASG